MRTAGDAFFVRDRLRRLCEKWSALPPWLYCSARSYDFLLSCTFCTRRLVGMLCVHVYCHDEGILLTVRVKCVLASE